MITILFISQLQSSWSAACMKYLPSVHRRAADNKLNQRLKLFCFNLPSSSVITAWPLLPENPETQRSLPTASRGTIRMLMLTSTIWFLTSCSWTLVFTLKKMILETGDLKVQAAPIWRNSVIWATIVVNITYISLQPIIVVQRRLKNNTTADNTVCE